MVIDVVTGASIRAEEHKSEGALLSAFAEVSPDLFAPINISWDTLFAVLDTPKTNLEFQDLVLVAKKNIFVAQRLESDPGLTLLSVTPAEKGVGLAISEARRQIIELLPKVE